MSRKYIWTILTQESELARNVMDPLNVECTPTYILVVIIPVEREFYVVLNSFLVIPQDFLFLSFYNFSLRYNFCNVHYGIKEGARLERGLFLHLSLSGSCLYFS
jgi:hypothetical protein